MIKTYNNFINESLKDKLKGKSKEEILNSAKKLTPEEKLKKGARYGVLPLIKQSIEEGADPSYNHNYAIRYASQEGHLDVVKELLKDERVDPVVWDNRAIELASQEDHLEVVKELMKDKRVINKLSKKDLKYYKNQISNLNESLKDKLKGKSENEILNNVKDLTSLEKLRKGSKNGILFLVKQGIKEGADPSDYNNFTIRFASANGHLDIVKYLLKDDRVDPSDYNNDAIKQSSYYGHLDIVKELLKDKRVDPSDYNNDAIRYSSDHGHLEIVKELLKDKRVINKLSKKKLDYYKKQVSNLNESLKDKLKGKNFDDIIKNLGNNYNKILLKSIEYNYMDGVRYAIDNGADIYYNDGMTMVIAITFNNLDAIKILLDLDYEYFSEEISNSLYLMKECNYDVVKYLLENFEFDDYQIDQTIKYLKYFSSKKDILNLFKKYKSEHIYDNDDKNLKYFFDNDDYINFKKTINKDNYSKGLIDDIFLISCETGKTKYVEYLLQKKLADINTKDGAPMRNACYYGNLDVVKILIKYGINPTKEHADIAESHFHSNISDYILKYLNKINESLKDKLKGKSENEILNNVKYLSSKEKLYKGVKHGILFLVKQSIEEGTDPSFNNNEPIKIASQYGHLNIVKELLKDKRVNPSDLNNEVIRFASQNGHLDVVKELMKDERVDPSDNYSESLKQASYYGHLDVVKELLKDDRVDPSDENNFAIRFASLNGNLDVVKELLKDDRVDPSDYYNYAIKQALKFDKLDIVKELLKDDRVKNKLNEEELKEIKNIL